MGKVLGGVIWTTRRVPFWIVIGVIAVTYEILYMATTTRLERRIDRMMEDVRIAEHGNPAAGRWLQDQYWKKLAEEGR